MLLGVVAHACKPSTYNSPNPIIILKNLIINFIAEWEIQKFIFNLGIVTHAYTPST